VRIAVVNYDLLTSIPERTVDHSSTFTQLFNEISCSFCHESFCFNLRNDTQFVLGVFVLVDQTAVTFVTIFNQQDRDLAHELNASNANAQHPSLRRQQLPIESKRLFIFAQSRSERLEIMHVRIMQKRDAQGLLRHKKNSCAIKA
jgi:hypothetical protein